VDPVLAASLVTNATALLGLPVTYVLGRRGRSAAASRDEADAVESLTASVIQQGQRLDQVSTALWEANQRLAVAESRAAAADQRAAASEARAAAADQRAAAADLRAATSDAELVRLRGQVEQLRAELAAYEAAGTADQRVT
jgi:chromosome segregation ATPase